MTLGFGEGRGRDCPNNTAPQPNRRGFNLQQFNIWYDLRNMDLDPLAECGYRLRPPAMPLPGSASPTP